VVEGLKTGGGKGSRIGITRALLLGRKTSRFNGRQAGQKFVVPCGQVATSTKILEAVFMVMFLL